MPVVPTMCHLYIMATLPVTRQPQKGSSQGSQDKRNMAVRRKGKLKRCQQKAGAASVLLDLSMLSVIRGCGPIHYHVTDIDIHDGCISQMAKLRRENQQTVTEFARQ